MESLNKNNKIEEEQSDYSEEEDSKQLCLEYATLLGKLQGLKLNEKPPSRETKVLRQKTNVLDQSNIEDDAKVVWNYDGQVRHRLSSQALRNKNTVVDLKKRQEAVGKLTDFP